MNFQKHNLTIYNASKESISIMFVITIQQVTGGFAGKHRYIY